MHMYSWRNTNYPVKAEEAASELQRIEQKYGEVTPRNLLDESTPEDAVMHNCYEWDDSKAADNYRLWQSRHIMSCLVVTYADEAETEPKEIVVRAFQNVSEEREGRFISVEKAFESTTTRDIILQKAFEELAMFRKKYSDLSELAKVITAIDEAIEKAN